MGTLFVESDDQDKIKALELYLKALEVPYKKTTLKNPKEAKNVVPKSNKKVTKK
jgi:mRNA-degrading endonuclease HigB of HigAB toxin-antitoxin module